jgi:dTDP-4-dehydrorhamnose reductase
VDLIERDLSGIIHAGGGRAISWFEYARLIFREAGINARLQPTSEREYRTLARRPRFSALSNSKMESLGLDPMPLFEEAVRQYLRIRERAAGA